MPARYCKWVTVSGVSGGCSTLVREWQQRPLEPMYPVVFFDALRVKIRDEGVVSNKAIYQALGVAATTHVTCWAFGSSRPRGPSSGCGW